MLIGAGRFCPHLNPDINSGIPNSPAIIIIIGTPSCKYSVPNVNRGPPVCGSIPISPTNAPIPIAQTLNQKFFETINATQAIDNVMNINSSGTPNLYIIGA